MIERTITLPLLDNDKQPLTEAHHLFAAFLLQVAGGYSKQEQSGAWVGDDGQVYFDESIKYTVVCDSQADAKIAARLPGLCYLAKQQALLTTSRTLDASFVTSPWEQVAS